MGFKSKDNFRQVQKIKIYITELFEIFITLLFLLCGGCSKSQNCNNASLSGLETCVEVVVVHSTKYGYKLISCSQALLSSIKQRHTIRQKLFISNRNYLSQRSLFSWILSELSVL